jgi:hypothetical protein
MVMSAKRWQVLIEDHANKPCGSSECGKQSVRECWPQSVSALAGGGSSRPKMVMRTLQDVVLDLD